MFGYVRPWKAELRVKEFVRYRAVYCGICKTISRSYGQLPRLGVTYDMTFLALLLLSLEEDNPGQEMQNCVLHPGSKNPMAKPSRALDFAAAATVLLAWHKAQDNVEDGEKVVLSRMSKLMFSLARKKARASYPELEALIEARLADQRAAEALPPEQVTPERISRPFAELLGGMMRLAPVPEGFDPKLRDALAYMGENLGLWVYLMDAVDDLEEDRKKGRFNPLIQGGKEEALRLMREAEDRIDAVGQLLPFKRDAAILGNIIQLGLPAAREQVTAGRPLTRL